MRIATLIGLLLLIAVPAPAQEAPAPSTKPATTTAPTTTPIDVVAEKDKLKALVGKDATVRGKVVEVFVPRSGSVTILNFFAGPERRDFNVVIDKANMDAVNAAFNGDVAAAVKDQTVLVTGTVSEYRGNPQIKVERPEQIKIEAAKEEKKE
jgi:DNA/RNA endonuclease YhcR with UshA esterase domain